MPTRLLPMLVVAVALGRFAGPCEVRAQAGDRQEEARLEGLLKKLEIMCKRMRQMQAEIGESVVALHKQIEANADKKPRDGDKVSALKLVARQKTIIAEATAALELLQQHGTAVAFPEVFEQIRGDMIQARRRLAQCDLGKTTQTLVDDIVATLREMTEPIRCGPKQAGPVGPQ